MQHLLTDIGIAIVAATLLGFLAHFLRQPIILGYLIAGALIGPIGQLVKDPENINVISEMGLILLLFIIGLELNLKEILRAGKQLLISGFGQFPLCAIVGVGLFGAMGFGIRVVKPDDKLDGLYLALTCALSSTAVVVKLLYDKAELDTLPGRASLGILVIQDIFAIFILAFQPNFAHPSIFPILQALGGTLALLVGGFLVSRFILQWVFTRIAKSPEMVVALSIGWCAVVAGAADRMHLSREMGALIAGLSIGAFPYSLHVTAKTLPLRDFFLTLFFVSLGMQIVAPKLSMVLLVLGLVVFVILSRFISVYPLLKFAGAGRRTAFITSVNIAQISEFSLVIANLGANYGHISQNTVTALIYAMAITAVMSSYTIRYNHALYILWNKWLTKRGWPVEDETTADAGASRSGAIAILGYYRAARAFVEGLIASDSDCVKRLIVIDFNPENLAEVRAMGIEAHFGDVSSLDTLEHNHLEHASVILCTIPDMLLKGASNLTLLKSCRAIAPHARIVVTANDAEHASQLAAEGAALIINPNELVGAHLQGQIQTLIESSHPHNQPLPSPAQEDSAGQPLAVG